MSLLLLSAIVLNGKSLRIELNEYLNNSATYSVIDTRDEKQYKKGHIKGALNFPILKTYEHKTENGKVINPMKMQTIVRTLGLDTSSNILIYDSGSFLDAARMFWTFEVYGFQNVKLLNIDFTQWSKDQKSTQYISTDIPHTKQSKYIATIDHKRLATKFTTLIATKNPNQIIIDARNNPFYRGEKSKAKRYGHIPKAINIPANVNISKDSLGSKLKTVEQLKEIYKKFDKKHKIITYCTHGKSSAANYFALRELEYDVAAYDSSWQEWGNDFALPIENPSKK